MSRQPVPRRRVAFWYDSAGRLTSESLTITFVQTTTYTVQSAYDAANRRTGITYPDGSVVTRQYTARDQLAQIDYNSNMVASFGYDNGRRRTSRTLGDTRGRQTTWAYGRQDDLPTGISSDIAGASFTYTYDANKKKLTEGVSAPMANYGFNSTVYDQADRLTAGELGVMLIGVYPGRKYKDMQCASPFPHPPRQRGTDN